MKTHNIQIYDSGVVTFLTQPFAYDPAAPTKYTEILSYIISKNLVDLAWGEYQIRQSEPADNVGVADFLADLVGVELNYNPEAARGIVPPNESVAPQERKSRELAPLAFGALAAIPLPQLVPIVVGAYLVSTTISIISEITEAISGASTQLQLADLIEAVQNIDEKLGKIGLHGLMDTSWLSDISGSLGLIQEWLPTLQNILTDAFYFDGTVEQEKSVFWHLHDLFRLAFTVSIEPHGDVSILRLGLTEDALTGGISSLKALLKIAFVDNEGVDALSILSRLLEEYSIEIDHDSGRVCVRHGLVSQE